MAKKTNYEKNGNSYFRVSLTIGKNEKGERIRKEFYGLSKKEAESKKNEYIKMTESGIDVELSKQTLSNAMYTWIWEIEKNNGLKAGTFERYEGIYRNYIKESEIANLRVLDIKALSIQRYYNNLLAAGKTYSQISHLHKCLNKFFNYAFNEGYINRNPCKGAKIPMPKTEKEIEIFTEDEINRIMKALEGNRLKVLTKFALGTGTRMGELLALTWEDIDLKGMTINITKSATFEKEYTDEKNWKYVRKVIDPKTYTSKRLIPFPSSLLDDIKEQKKNNAIEKMKIGQLYQDENLVFPNSFGGLDDRMNIGKIHRKILTSAKVPHKKFHTYRHTFVSIMQSKGVPLETISKLIGHSTYKTTVDTYLHVSIADAGQAINNMNDTFAIK